LLPERVRVPTPLLEFVTINAPVPPMFAATASPKPLASKTPPPLLMVTSVLESIVEELLPMLAPACSTPPFQMIWLV